MPRAASQNGASAEAALKRLQAIPSLDEVTTGATAKDVVWTRNKTTLCRYRRETEPTHRVPVVLVYALINRPYILDLRPGNSFVEFLLGEDVQAALPESMYVFPVRDGVDLPRDWARFAERPATPYTLDPAEVDASRDEWLTTWQDVVTR